MSLFIQCLVDRIYPEVGEAMVQIFRRLGISLACPTKQTCCGQPAYNSGYLQESRVAAQRFISIFESADAIVCPSGSCVTMVRHHYPKLFSADDSWLQRAQRVSDYMLTDYADGTGVEFDLIAKIPAGAPLPSP